MNKFVLAFLVSSFAFVSAQAADNAITLTPGSGVTERSIDVGAGIQSPGVSIVNSAGTNLIGASSSVPVSGTVAATQSGTWNIGTLGAITSPVAATQSGAWTITQGPAGAAAWLVTGAGGTFPVTQSGAWTVGVSSITNPVAVTQSGTWNIAAVTSITNPVAATQSGTWTVQPGNVANTTAWLVTGVGGVFPASQSGAWNITNISGTVSLPTGAATSANQPSNAALGSTTAGQTGNLSMGAVTTAAPTYVTGQSNALSLDTAGNLRVNVTASGAGGTSSNFGATFPVSGTAVGLTNGANMVAWSATTNYGVAPAAIAVPAVNAAVTNTVAGNVTQWASTTRGAPTAWGTAPSGNVPGVNVNIQGCAVAICNSNGQAPMANSAPVVIANNQSAVPTQQTSQYPVTSTPLTASATGTTAATTATLTGAASVTTYLCGFSIRANATAAATGNATVTGPISGTLNFTQWTATATSGLGVTEEVFIPCVPASAVNTAIAVVSAAPGTGGVVSVTAWGYRL